MWWRGGAAADGIEQRIVGAPAGRELDADHPRAEAAVDLGQGMVGVVGIDRDVAPDPVGMLTLQGEHRVVAVSQVGG